MYEDVERLIENLMDSKPNKPKWYYDMYYKNKEPKWNYTDGCMLEALLALYRATNDKKYIESVISFVDFYLDDDGNLFGYNPENYSTDDVSGSRVFFELYEYTKNEKYLKAIELCYYQVENSPRTKEGNFWHKKIYPNQIWLDGLYMAQVFYIKYLYFKGIKDYSDIVNQLKNVKNIMYNKETKLYYHGYDSSKSMFWANKETGLSKCYWLRAIGWYLMALVDVIEYLKGNDFDIIKDIIKLTIDGLLIYQDKESKMFYQVIDKIDKKGNYLETSGTAMIAYSILKAIRLNALPKEYKEIGLEIFDGICNKYLKEDSNNIIHLDGICRGAGLGPENNLKRDGTYEYYVSCKPVIDDAKGSGPFIMAYAEIIRNLK